MDPPSDTMIARRRQIAALGQLAHRLGWSRWNREMESRGWRLTFHVAMFESDVRDVQGC